MTAPNQDDPSETPDNQQQSTGPPKLPTPKKPQAAPVKATALGDVPTATGATGIVGLGLYLGDPWNIILPIAGPYLAIVGTRILAWLQPGSGLFSNQVGIFWTEMTIKDPVERKKLIDEFEENKKHVLQDFASKIRLRTGK